LIKRKLVAASITSLISATVYGLVMTYLDMKDGAYQGPLLKNASGNILVYGMFIYLVVLTFGVLSSVFSELISEKLNGNRLTARGIAHVVFGILGILILAVSFTDYRVRSLKEAVMDMMLPAPWFAPILISLLFFGIDEWLRNSPVFKNRSIWFSGFSLILLLIVIWRVSLAF
jgi:hypothetical protein